MSLRFYGFAPELDGSANGKLKAGRFQGIMGVLDSLCGKVRFRKFWFDVVGTTAAAVLDHAVYVYEQVANMSLGVIFSASLGHYRNDELPSVLAANKRANGYVIVSTGCNDGLPKTMSQRLRFRMFWIRFLLLTLRRFSLVRKPILAVLLVWVVLVGKMAKLSWRVLY